MALDEFPLTPNGKVNRQALPRPGPAPVASGEVELPRTPLEKQLAEIWEDLLSFDPIGIHDNFFQLGGHSVLAMMMMSRVQRDLQAKLTIRNVFETPTIAGLARKLESTLNANL
jgi:aryl carrier-like protein